VFVGLCMGLAWFEVGLGGVGLLWWGISGLSFGGVRLGWLGCVGLLFCGVWCCVFVVFCGIGCGGWVGFVDCLRGCFGGCEVLCVGFDFVSMMPWWRGVFQVAVVSSADGGGSMAGWFLLLVSRYTFDFCVDFELG